MTLDEIARAWSDFSQRHEDAVFEVGERVAPDGMQNGVRFACASCSCERILLVSAATRAELERVMGLDEAAAFEWLKLLAAAEPTTTH